MRLMNDVASIKQEFEEYMYTISHDLRTPARHIHSFSELLMNRLDDHADPKNREYLSYILNGATQINQMLTSLEILSRIVTRAEPHEEVALESLVVQSLDTLDSLIEETKATIEMGDLPVVTVETQQMQMVFTELIKNALAAGDGKRPLHISLSATEEADSHHIKVADNGRGMPSDICHRVFDLFYSYGPESDKATNMGMGLPYVKKIIERHGGSVSLKSEEQQGTIVTLLLPK